VIAIRPLEDLGADLRHGMRALRRGAATVFPQPADLYIDMTSGARRAARFRSIPTFAGPDNPARESLPNPSFTLPKSPNYTRNGARRP